MRRSGGGRGVAPRDCCPDDPSRCPLAEESADAAVRKVFAILGVDIDKPESVEAFREDLRFGRKLRKAADHGFLALIGLLVVAAGTAMLAGVIAKVKGG